MDPIEYQRNAILTSSPEYLPECIDYRVIHAAMGLGTEAGEFLDSVKKAVFYGGRFDRTNAIEELGDILWYVALACTGLGTDIPTVMARNINKLQERYPSRAWSISAATKRHLDQERKALEK